MFKYKLVMLVLFLFLATTFYYVEGKNNALPLFGKIIYIDPGHGGRDPGAIYKNIHEADINLEISKKLEKSLEERGAIVYMTRYDDYDLSVKYTNNRKRSDLSRRVNIINTSDCDMYISIHLNADPSSTWQGIQTFYDDINPENKKLADHMQQLFKKRFHTKREVKRLTDIYLHRKVEKLGILVEAGFLTNPNDRYLLKQTTHQQKIANIITEGVISYFDI